MEKLSVYILKEWLVFSNADESNVNVGKLKFFFYRHQVWENVTKQI